MDEQANNRLEQIAMNNLPQGLFIFDTDGSLLLGNNKGRLLVEAFEQGAMILCEDDLVKLFNLEPLLGKNHFENKYVVKGQRCLYVQRKRTEQIVLYYLIDTSGERQRIAALHQQTSEALWQIRSRITTIQNALAYIADYETSRFDEETVDLLLTSRLELWRLSRHADNLRDLSLLNANTLSKQIDLEPVRIQDCYDDAVSNIELLNKSMKKRIDYSCQNLELSAFSDKNRLTRILESILINSVTYGVGDMALSISAADNNDKTITIRISDNGPGILETELPHIFEYGFRGEIAKKSDYSGLGMELYLARQIILLMNGRIEIANGDNGGLETLLTLRKD